MELPCNSPACNAAMRSYNFRNAQDVVNVDSQHLSKSPRMVALGHRTEAGLQRSCNVSLSPTPKVRSSDAPRLCSRMVAS